MIITILLVGLLLRLIGINQSFWLDEAIGVVEVSKHGFNGLLTSFLHVDNHPPLYYLTLDVWTQIFGYTEPVVRMLTVFLGVGTIYFTYKLAEIISNKQSVSLFVAFLLSISQFHIYYSQEARMYSMAAFFVSFASYYYLKTFNTNNIWNWFMFAVGLVGLSFSDYMPLLLLPAFPLYALITRKNKSWWIKFICAHIPLFILGLLWIPTFLIQSQGGAWLLQTLPQWRTVAGGANLKQVALLWMKFIAGRVSLDNKLFYYGFVVLSSLPIVYVLLQSIKVRSKLVFPFICIALPLVAGFLVSIFIPAFIYFRFTYIIPAFYIVVGIGVMSIKKPAVRLGIITALVTSGVISLLVYYLDHTQQREQWRHAVNWVESKGGNSTVVLFSYPEPFAPYRWYQTGKVEALGATDSISANQIKTIEKTNSIIKEVNKIYYFDYLADLSDPQRYVLHAARIAGFEETSESKVFHGVGAIRELVRK